MKAKWIRLGSQVLFCIALWAPSNLQLTFIAMGLLLLTYSWDLE